MATNNGSNTKSIEELFKGFSKLSQAERFQRLLDMGALTSEDQAFLEQGGLKDFHLAETFIENPIGYFQLPIGVVTNLRIDGEDVVVPMAVEETSIIAAASKTARWIREKGALTTSLDGETIIGQVQIPNLKNKKLLEKALSFNKEKWIEDLNQNPANGMFQRGGGVQDLRLRFLKRPEDKSTESEMMAVLHVYLDPCDAMGANVINQVCEYLSPKIQELTGESIGLRILSNLVDTKVTCARVLLKDVEPTLGIGIEEASIFAEVDPYRAATNNKGVMNGIDPILIATGNDWRAVEAGAHAYVAKDGGYGSLTKWRYNKLSKELTGELVAPLICGTVGGVTQLHPLAKMSLKMMNIQDAGHLSRICAAVGLIQNLGALRALSTVGIIEGHMKLHIKNIVVGSDASEQESPELMTLLERKLQQTKRVTQSDADSFLKQIRQS